MKIKDQIAAGLCAKQMSVVAFARSLEVNPQTVRHWLSGRGFPKKRRVAAIERLLDLRLDFSEGATPSTMPTALEALSDADRRFVAALPRLSEPAKDALYVLMLSFSRDQAEPRTG